MENEYPYSFDKFDEDYYGNRARGGFGEEINWDNQIQQYELQKKFDTINNNAEYNSILFIGCALGGEVRYFRERGKEAYGVEVSEYAVNNCEPSVKDFVKLYNGWQLDSFADKSIDVIASFDVLTLIPDDLLNLLIPEMCRVALNKIIFRNIVDIDGSKKGEYAGNDGVTYRYLTIPQWTELFNKSGFVLTSKSIHNKYETIFVFERKNS